MSFSTTVGRANWFARKTCRLCGASDLKLVSALAPMAIATTNFSTSDVPSQDALFREAVSMDLYLCGSCGHLQLMNVGNPDIQYRDYVYTTSLSLGLPRHFVDAADHLIKKLSLAKASRVVEFGSNDGTYLRAFKAVGMDIVGIDPARSIAAQATEAGIPTYSDFFNKEVAEKIRQERGAADLIVANNVIANIDDLAGVFHGAKSLLADGGAFVFETQYGVDVTESYLLDTIYHEHLSYFNVLPLVKALGQYGLELFDVERIPTKGGSIRAYVQAAKGPRRISDEVSALAKLESDIGTSVEAYYHAFENGIAALRTKIRALVDDVRARGGAVAGYGVSVGTSTLLAQFGLTDRIDFLVDDDRAKPAVLRGPGYDIPVYFGPDALVSRKPALTVVFAWRYVAPIVKANQAYRDQGGRFLVPLPAPTII